MTNETNAALSALKLALDGIGQMPFGCSLSAMQSRYLGEAYRAFHTIAASQREAPVVEGVPKEEFMRMLDFASQGHLGARERVWMAYEAIARRLAERPTVTNAMTLLEVEKFVGDWDFARRNGGTHTSNLALLRDRIFALRLPAPGKAADEGGWISVTNSRPDGAYDVLVYYGDAERKIIGMGCFDGSWWPRHENTPPTHWKKLPEAPK